MSGKETTSGNNEISDMIKSNIKKMAQCSAQCHNQVREWFIIQWNTDYPTSQGTDKIMSVDP